MSHNLVRAVWERKDLDASERLVLLSLADHADEDGFCYPSVKRLCERTSLAERTVQGTIKKLVRRGFVSVRYGQGRNGTNAFVVNAAPAADAPKPSLNHQEDKEPPLIPPKRKRAIPPNWVPSDRNIQDASTRQFSAEEIDDEAAKFRDYHLAKGSTFLDWDAAWRTWLGNARKWQPKRTDNSSAFLRSVARAAGSF